MTGSLAIIPRARLTAICDGPLPALILLRAPAGFGKSVLLAQCAARLRARGLAVVQLRSRQSSPPSLESQFETRRGGAILLDDFDAASPADVEACRRQLELEAGSSTLMIATRTRPDLPVSRLKLAGQAIELDADTLAFDEAECASLWSASAARSGSATPAQIGRLTGGWPAALGFILGARDVEFGALDTPEALLRSHRELADYLESVTLANAPAPSRAFLLATGTLGTFTGHLAARVTGIADAQALASALCSQGAFLEPDRQDGEWWRYQPLVAAFLKWRQRCESAHTAQRIHQRASRVMEEQGRLADAIEHAFAADDLDRAVLLLARSSDTHQRIGHWRRFSGWLANLPFERLNAFPEIHIEAAAAMAVLFEFDAARRHLEAARAASDRLSPRSLDDLMASEAILAAFADDPEAAFAVGQRSPHDPSARNAYSLGALKSAGGLGWIGRGFPEKARRVLAEARAAHQRSGSHFGTVFSLGLTGLAYAMEGELTQAVAEWREAEAIIRPLPVAAALVATAVGYLPAVLYEWDELSEANATLERSLARSTEVALPDILAQLYLTAARIALAEGDPGRSAKWLDDAEVLGLQRRWPRLVECARWERIRGALARERWDDARRLNLDRARQIRLQGGGAALGSLLEGGELGRLRLSAHLAPDRALVSRCRGEAAKARTQNLNWRGLRLALIEAIARVNLDDRSGALRAVQRALELGAPSKMLRSFVDEGPVIVSIVEEIERQCARAVSTLDPSYLARILEVAGHAGRTQARRGAHELDVEPLSRREEEIVRMIAVGLSNQELAARLFISENTVKWHLQHVFAKLRVRNRTGAIAVARTAGILS